MGDPDLAQMMTNPKVMAAIAECTKNPMAIFQYQNDPEVGGWVGAAGGGMVLQGAVGWHCRVRQGGTVGWVMWVLCWRAGGLAGWRAGGLVWVHPEAEEQVFQCLNCPPVLFSGRLKHFFGLRGWGPDVSPPLPSFPPLKVLRVFEKMSALFPQAAGAGALPNMPPGFGPPPTQQ